MEAADLQQEVIAHWLAVRRGYEPERGATLATYLRRVAKAKLIDTEREVKAQKRGGGIRPWSLDAPVSSDSDAAVLGESLPASLDVEMEVDAKLRREWLLLQLSPFQRAVATGLEAGYAPAELALILGKSRSTIYAELQRIKFAFKDYA